jgi:lactoylglutathione lyase
MARLNLLVLRAHDPARLAAFYSCLGLNFSRHRHGSGPEHFASEDAGGVFEIYPMREPDGPSRQVRLGFAIVDVRRTVAQLSAMGVEIVSTPAASPWGLRAVVADPEGHRVELTEATTSATE